jgi:V/A-type H+-transporting ATPase subunit F
VKFYCIGDEDTVRGFRLAGIEGQVVTTDQEAQQTLQAVSNRSDIGVVLISDVIAAGIREEVDAVRLESEQPLLVEIPGPQGPLAGRKTLRQLVQEAVGIRITEE